MSAIDRVKRFLAERVLCRGIDPVVVSVLNAGHPEREATLTTTDLEELTAGAPPAAIRATLPEGADTRARRACHVMVTTTHSSDGRFLEQLFIRYNPEDSYALFLLEHALNSSEGVASYYVYDAAGERIKKFDGERFPKRI